MKLPGIPRQRQDSLHYTITVVFSGFMRNGTDLFASIWSGTMTDSFDVAAIGYHGPGPATSGVRKHRLDFRSQRARQSASGYCVVRGVHDCAHMLPDKEVRRVAPP